MGMLRARSFHDGAAAKYARKAAFAASLLVTADASAGGPLGAHFEKPDSQDPSNGAAQPFGLFRYRQSSRHSPTSIAAVAGPAQHVCIQRDIDLTPDVRNELVIRLYNHLGRVRDGGHSGLTRCSMSESSLLVI